MTATKKPIRRKRSSSNPCWKGYKKLGMKMKNGRRVPDCVPDKK